MVDAINIDLADITSDRLIAYDVAHFYIFKDGIGNLSESGIRAYRITLSEMFALYDKGRQRRIDAALEQINRDMRSSGAGSAEKTADGFAVIENETITALTESQFVDLARSRGWIAKDDPFFE